MRKMLTVAGREFRAMVATKAFLLSLVVMPVLMFGGILAMNFMGRLTKSETLRIAVWDPHDLFVSDLVKAAAIRNEALSATGQGTSDLVSQVNSQMPADLKSGAGLDNSNSNSTSAASDAAKSTNDSSGSKRSSGGPLAENDRFEVIRLTEATLDDAQRLELSAQVRAKQLHAFVEVPANLETWLADVSTNQAPNPALPSVQFYSEGSGLDSARRWIGEVMNQLAKNKRFEKLGLSPPQVVIANQPVPIQSMGLVTKRSDGSVTSEASRDMMTAMFLPMGIMMLMFMVVMMAAQPMLEAVLEEKSLRIAEVLLGSCNPSQLMMGKLLGTVAGSLLIFSFYLLGAIGFAWNQNLLSSVPLWVIPWFFLFQLFAVLFYSAIFMAIGVSVSQLKDAQPMMMPVWMMLMLPLMTWFVLVQKPDGAFAFWLSMFPPTASTVMVLRISTGVTVPFWQILLSLGLLVAATTLVVYLAGRIFRVGILWQGKTPKITDLLSWAFVK
ncbi:MAG: ABC transporter permease [Planctomycetaceae bacterium]|nr:ABC transporter permease [Planctomycetaceae bacterium]